MGNRTQITENELLVVKLVGDEFYCGLVRGFMNRFTYHTLTMLEDIGMSTRYPDIRHTSFADDGARTTHSSFFCMTGTRVSIEQNQSMKFMMMFMLLDFHIDFNYKKLEGESFASKYRKLPFENDYNLIIRELYRIAKVIRNSIVHSSSSFNFSDGKLDISYRYNNTDFGITMTIDALSDFYTSIVMYTKGDLGKGSYFLGIIRSIYKNLLSGISRFSDEFGDMLNLPSTGLEIKPYVRIIFIRPNYEVKGTNIKINIAKRDVLEWQGIDFYIEYEGGEFLIPEEVLSSDFIIDTAELLNNWRYESLFPPVKNHG